MENKPNIISISAYILLIVLFFMIGYFLGRITTSNKQTSTMRAELSQPAIAPTLAPETEFFRLKMVDENLILYRVTPHTNEEIYKIQIIEDIFPTQDISELRKGITFSNIYDAHSFIENFVS